MLIPFSPKPGLNSDDTTFSAEGRWADGNNVRFVNGRPQVIGGWVSLFSLSDTSFGIVRAIFPFTRAGSVVIAYGTYNAATGPRLLVGSGLSAPSDRTPAGLDSGVRHWSLDSWGDTLLAVPAGETLYEQSGSGTATAVAQAPDEITCMIVTNERQVLAGGCSEEGSGTFNAMCIRGCDTEDYTDWTSASDNNAFEHILPGHGQIVAMRRIGAYVAVWTNSALYLGQFIGDPAQTYRFDMVDENCGCVGQRAVVIHGGVAYWMGSDLKVRRWAVGGLPEILPSPISREFETNVTLSAVDLIAAAAVARHDEIWFHYKDVRTSDVSADNNRYIAVGLRDGSWFRGQAGRSAMLDSGLIGSLTEAHAGRPTTLGAITGAVYLHEVGSAGTGSSPIGAYIQSADQYLDNSQRRMMIRGIIHDVEDLTLNSGNVLGLTLYVRDRPMSAATTKGPYALTSASTKKDFRASGKIISARFALLTGAETPTPASGSYFRLGKQLFDAVPLGER